MRFVESGQRESVDIDEDWGQRRALRTSSAGGSPVRAPCPRAIAMTLFNRSGRRRAEPRFHNYVISPNSSSSPV